MEKAKKKFHEFLKRLGQSFLKFKDPEAVSKQLVTLIKR